MEFMQWLKAYFDGQTGGQAPEGYDAKTRRASSRTGDVRTAGTAGRGRPRQASCATCMFCSKVQRLSSRRHARWRNRVGIRRRSVQ